MTAIAVHHTAVDTKSPWDGPAEEAKAPNEEKTLHYMHAWVESGGDVNAKGSYKFPHHDAGTDTPANIAGVDNAMARLSSANIPEADRAGVKAHLQAHQEDAKAKKNQASSSSATHVAEVGDGGGKPPRPIRCFDGNAQPHEAFWRVRNAAETGGEPEMELYGVLSEYSWLDDDITPKMFKDALYALGGGGPITLRIDSPGGDVIAASVMRSIMTDYPGPITARIDGMAASAAVIVTMAAQKVKILDSAYMMIHDPAVVVFIAMLDIETLGRLHDSLQSIKDGIVDTYSEKTGLSVPRISKMMTDETWMSAQEAVQLGFANEVIGGGQKIAAAPVAMITNLAYVNALKTYVNVPPALLASKSVPVDDSEARKRLEEEQRLRDYIQVYKQKE